MAATAGGIRAGKAFVIIEAVDRTALVLRKVSANLKALGTEIMALGTRMLSIGAVSLLPTAFTVKAASDLVEATNRLNQVFGSAAAEAHAFVEEMANLGRSRREISEALSGFQGMFVGLGFGQQEAARMSTTLTGLALDFASFNNLSDGEAIERFLAGLSGSSEVFDRFGINIKEAQLKAQLAMMGVTGTATEQQKVLARLAIIQKAMGDQGATGDAVRTAGEFAGRMKALKGTIENVAASIGKSFLPVLVPLINGLRRFVEENETLITFLLLGGLAIGALGAATLAFGLTLKIVAFWLGAVAVLLKLTIGLVAFLLSPIGAFVALLVAGVVAFLRFTETGRATLSGLASGFGELLRIANQTIGMIGQAIKAGRWDLAAKAAWQGIKLAWLTGVDVLLDIWDRFKIAFWERLNAFRFGFLDVMSDLWAGIQVIWHEAIFGLRKLLFDLETEFLVFRQKTRNLNPFNNEELDPEVTRRQRDGYWRDEETNHRAGMDDIGDELDARRKAIKAAQDADNERRRKEADASDKAREDQKRKAQEDLDKTAEEIRRAAQAAAKEIGKSATPEFGAGDFAAGVEKIKSIRGLERGTVEAAEQAQKNRQEATMLTSIANNTAATATSTQDIQKILAGLSLAIGSVP